MKAITLWEPWATAMALGLKANETRHWLTHYRGDLAICSAKRKLDQTGLDIARENGVHLTGLKFGFVLCVVELWDCMETNHGTSARMKALFPLEEALGNYSPGRFAWRTKNLRRLASPVPVTGRQGLFNLPAAVEKMVREQLRKAGGV